MPKYRRRPGAVCARRRHKNQKIASDHDTEKRAEREKRATKKEGSAVLMVSQATKTCTRKRATHEAPRRRRAAVRAHEDVERETSKLKNSRENAMGTHGNWLPRFLF